MTLKTLPDIPHARLPETFAFELDGGALDRWQAGLRVSASAGDATIQILEVIGEDFWTGAGVTAKHVAAQLRQLGAVDVTVEINSPGGDFFEGVAIYNLLRNHKGKVTVHVLGLAASAASIIAMAGDQVEIAESGFIMIHNAWLVAVGNRHDLREAADILEPFDAAMAAVYASQAGAELKQVAGWMDAEKWFSGADAVEAGLADGLLDTPLTEDKAQAERLGNINATRRVEALLSRSGLSRRESRSLLSEVKKGGMPGAAANTMPDAGAFAAAARQLITTMKE